jgi:hypothetical protein
LNKMYFEWAWSLIHKKIVLFEKTAMRLWSQRQLPVQGVAGHPG